MKRDQNSTENDPPERVLRTKWGMICLLIGLTALWAYAGYVGYMAVAVVQPPY